MEWWCHPFFGYVFLCLPSGLSAQSLVLSAVWLKTCLSWIFQRSSCHAPGVRRGKKIGRQTWLQVSRRVPVLNLEFAHGRSGFHPTLGNLPKGRHGSGVFFFFFRWIFAVDCFVEKYKKIHRKKPPENPPAENKRSAGARRPRNPPARPKNPPQNLPTNPPAKPPSTRQVFFD